MQLLDSDVKPFTTAYTLLLYAVAHFSITETACVVKSVKDRKG